ncbi:glycoside hydrolase family 43 protein [Serinibacter arcticus]|uniref:Glycoside hydrolase family 43 protein n=2 Tax=Serinibacter arcticus TaxID=1655435 RepID=A0A2U1ZUI3_9MICO|nr:glycoside hydrolase family 43 protein [Serinibacter arcticus]
MDELAWSGATNPVLPGFHPDPSVCRVDEDGDAWFYLVTSTFEYLPGLPVHRSRDLVSWELVGHVVTDQIDFAGIGDSGGLYAPTIRHDGDRFLVVCELVGGPEGARGNFIVTAPEAAGPWSAPVWWPEATGGDLSLLIDGDRIWAHGARQTKRQDWNGQGEVWVREVDPRTLALIGPESVVFTSAVHGGIWTEGPHLYRRGEFVHLVAAEGGTGRDHAVVTGRASRPTDVFTVNANNPVLTHRHLGPGAAVVNVGHADLVEAPDGTWWAVVLASRLVDGVDLLGRETFLVRADWVDDHLVLAPGTGTLVPEPGGPAASTDGSQPADRAQEEPWVAVRRLPGEVVTPDEDGVALRLAAGAGPASPTPAFVGRRLLAPCSTITLELSAPVGDVTEVGLVVRQSSTQWLTAALRPPVSEHDGGLLVVTRCVDGVPQDVATLAGPGAGIVRIGIRGRSAEVSWEGETGARVVAQVDVGHLSTTVSHGFVGVVVGPYAVGSGEVGVRSLRQAPLLHPGVA